MNRVRLFVAAAVSLGLPVLSGCTATPSVTKERMTLGEAGIDGLDCRRVQPMGTNQQKTICASPEAWAQVEAKERRESELMFEAARGNSNNSRFNRGN